MTRCTSRSFAGVLLATLVLAATVTVAAPPEPNGEPRSDPARPWAHHVDAVDRALARQDTAAAVRAWHEAYTAALGSRGWAGMLDAGAAYIRIGKVSGVQNASVPKARQFYLIGLYRARGQRSLDGVLQTAQAFGDLGDREVVEQCLRIATELAGDHPASVARVNAFRARWTDGHLASPTLPY